VTSETSSIVPPPPHGLPDAALRLHGALEDVLVARECGVPFAVLVGERSSEFRQDIECLVEMLYSALDDERVFGDPGAA
jgi:hypothetical protein